MADLSITALPAASQLSASDLLYVAIPNPLSPIGFSLCKMTSAQFGLFLNKQLLFASDLETDSKNIIGAINELKAGGGGGGASVIQLTAAEYAELTQEEKINGSIYKLTDKAIFYCLDEEYHPIKELTSAQYEALTTAEQNNGTIYIQTDAETTGEDIPVNTITPNTSINSAINACFGRTGSDIAVSSSDPTMIAETIDAIGTIASASWTGTSSSAYGTNLTGAISLTKGVYIVTIKTPVSDITPLIELHDNTNDRSFYYTNIPSQGSFTIPIELTATTDIIVRSAASTATSYSYLERGGLFAVRIK